MTVVRIEKSVPLTIFEYPEIKERLDTLFDVMEKDIKNRLDEIMFFLCTNANDIYKEISYNDVYALFKIYFCKSILNEAIEITFEETGRFNMALNIFDLLSEEKLKQAILGKPMIDAFERHMRALPRRSVLIGSTMFMLEKKFLSK